MKTLKRFSAALALSTLLCITAMAGETQSPPCAPGEMNAPPCGSVITTGGPSVPGEMQTPPAYAVADPILIVEFAVSLLL
jgi:hypothetical protein